MAGDCAEGLLGGNCGTVGDFVKGFSVSPVPLIVGEGRETRVVGADGSFPTPLLLEMGTGGAAEEDLSIGGFGGGGLGLTLAGPGVLPTCPRFKAAIRA